MVLEEFEAVLKKMYERQKEILSRSKSGRADGKDKPTTTTTTPAEKESATTRPSEDATIIFTPHDNDVIGGRGHKANVHPGNVLFRSYVSAVKVDYVMSPKRDKPKYAKEVVQRIKNQDPPGRFLKSYHRSHDEGSDNNSANQGDSSIFWKDIGDKEALSKTRQALREGAASIWEEVERRKKQQSRRVKKKKNLSKQK